ncbi:MAG: hypothetical protein U0172_04100 [Nitrospiraceae bacterium]
MAASYGTRLGLCAGIGLLAIAVASPASAETRSYYSPLLKVDVEQGFIVIANSGAVIGIEVPPEAKPHLEKLPISGLIDLVVETRGDKPPLLKRWKLASGDSTCRIFDGKECK